MTFVLVIIIVVIVIRQQIIKQELKELRRQVEMLQRDDVARAFVELKVEPSEEQTKEAAVVPTVAGVSVEATYKKENTNTEHETLVQPVRDIPKESALSKKMKELLTVESIISKLGITLLLIGVGFIFKLAYDNGYITEGMALLVGALIGIALIGLGYKVALKGRLVLRQVLVGGGIATLYTTTYAAYQGYDIIPGVLAFIFMCLITFGGAFFISVTLKNVSIAVIGMTGALLTPFLVPLDQLGLTGVGLYIGVLALSSMIIYVFRRWRTLQLTNIVGSIFITTLLLADGGGVGKADEANSPY